MKVQTVEYERRRKIERVFLKGNISCKERERLAFIPDGGVSLWEGKEGRNQVGSVGKKKKTQFDANYL